MDYRAAAKETATPNLNQYIHRDSLLSKLFSKTNFSQPVVFLKIAILGRFSGYFLNWSAYTIWQLYSHLYSSSHGVKMEIKKNRFWMWLTVSFPHYSVNMTHSAAEFSSPRAPSASMLAQSRHAETPWACWAPPMFYSHLGAYDRVCGSLSAPSGIADCTNTHTYTCRSAVNISWADFFFLPNISEMNV